MRSLAGFVIAVISLFPVSLAFAEEEFSWELFGNMLFSDI